MLNDGRLTPETVVWKEGMAEWLPANRVPDLLFNSAPAPAPATMPAEGSVVAQPAPGAPYTMAPQTNGMAIASLILGIVSFVFGFMALTGIPAVITGHIARRQIRENPHNQSGDGLAVGGLVTGYLSIILTAAVIAFFVVIILFAAKASTSSGPSPSPPVVYPSGP